MIECGMTHGDRMAMEICLMERCQKADLPEGSDSRGDYLATLKLRVVLMPSRRVMITVVSCADCRRSVDSKDDVQGEPGLEAIEGFLMGYNLSEDERSELFDQIKDFLTEHLVEKRPQTSPPPPVPALSPGNSSCL
jgi:hypothetical protein